jgi:N-methylhydantoinase B
MCRRRIRVPDQWYGDYLAALGAARIGERRLKDLVTKYGRDVIRQFIVEWFDYSERRMMNAIRKLPACELVGEGVHDPFPAAPEGIPLKLSIKVEPSAGRIDIDLRDNGDCLPAGINESRTCAMNNVITGVFNSIDPSVPHNAGSFRRISVLLRENCVAGIPRFPASCSVATTNVADRLVNITQAAFAQIGDGFGLAEGGMGLGPNYAVISGSDWRHGGAPYVNQLIIASNGGPASPRNDGWLTYGVPVVAGLMYRDSVELDELKYPIHFSSVRVRTDSGGPGKFRGAPGLRVVYGPKKDPMTSIYLIDGHHNPPRGVRGGSSGAPASAVKIDREGTEIPLPPISVEVLRAGEFIVGNDSGGGGYGDPLERDPQRVLHDVIEKWVSPEQAQSVYGVVLAERDGRLAVDSAATAQKRKTLRRTRAASVNG